MKKFFALLLALLLLCPCLASCADKSIKLPKPDNGEVVFTVAGEKMYYDYVKYVYLNTKADMEYIDEDCFEDEGALEELKKATLDTVIHNKAIALLAKKYKITLSESDKKEVAEALEAYKADKGSWEAIKEENFMTDYSFSYIQRFTALWSKAFQHITNIENGIIKCDDATVLADIPINFRRISYIYLSYAAADKSDIVSLAESVLEEAKNGGDFAALIKEHGDDPQMDALIDVGYYYTVGSITPEVEEAVEKLQSGEMSEIIDDGGGLFIVKRHDVDMEYAENNMDDFVEQYLARRFNEMVEEIKKDMKITYSDFWTNLKLDDIK